jgi:quercetin 2,3-dioxygenase
LSTASGSRSTQLAYLGTGRDAVTLHTSGAGRALLIGGVPLDDEIIIWWNFVGHDRAAIEQAQRDWEQRTARFGDIPDAVGRRLEPPPIPWASG